MDKSLRLDILRQVETGELSLDKASELLNQLEKSASTDLTSSVAPDYLTPEEPTEKIFPEDATKEDVKKPGWAFVFWLIPMVFGGLIIVSATSWLYQSYTTSGLGFRFWLSWIPFLIGLLLVYLGFVLNQARWIHIHVRQPEGQKPSRIIIGFPLPVRLIMKLLPLFRNKLPESFQEMDLEAMLSSLDESFSAEEPIIINVGDEDGSKVEIYIG
ncbi:MAG: hypothetical protein CL609_16350 [Anaerolineaceae bacterium]|nr:hypothetical protein [Anaerolineaceae bacterium]